LNTARQKLRRSEAFVTQYLLGLNNAEIDPGEVLPQRADRVLPAMVLAGTLALRLVKKDHFPQTGQCSMGESNMMHLL
jgi:hypothetical protein